ncbi:MAG: sulfatase-like hydrolase/transferase, partial [Bacteroidales bacterium]|nr:sulfatase-like hydrolase/transferase [Bacteroidales bacterium]
EWAVERLNRPYDRPFFLAVGFLRPHVPWYVPQKWFDMHPVETLQLPPYRGDDLVDLPPRALQMNEDLPMMPTTEWAIETGEWKNILQAYLACVTFVDHYIGAVLDALEKSEHKDNTIVVLWSDHGYRLGEKGTFSKHCLWQEATHAPLIISTQGTAKSAICSRPVEMLDIYPTLLDLCGLPDYEKMEGKSLRPLLENPGADAGDYAVCTFGRKNHAVVSDLFMYIQYEDGSEEFYDHGNDPNEWTNRAGDTIYAADIQEMKKQLPATNAPLTLKTK